MWILYGFRHFYFNVSAVWNNFSVQSTNFFNIKMQLKVFIIIVMFSLFLNKVKSDMEMDGVLMDDVMNQLKSLEAKNLGKFSTTTNLEKYIVESVKIAFTVGCDSYKAIMEREFIYIFPVKTDLTESIFGKLILVNR